MTVLCNGDTTGTVTVMHEAFPGSTNMAACSASYPCQPSADSLKKRPVKSPCACKSCAPSQKRATVEHRFLSKSKSVCFDAVRGMRLSWCEQLSRLYRTAILWESFTGDMHALSQHQAPPDSKEHAASCTYAQCLPSHSKMCLASCTTASVTACQFSFGVERKQIRRVSFFQLAYCEHAGQHAVCCFGKAMPSHAEGSPACLCCQHSIVLM